MTGRHGWGTETSKGKGRRCRDLVSGQKRNLTRIGSANRTIISMNSSSLNSIFSLNYNRP